MTGFDALLFGFIGLILGMVVAGFFIPKSTGFFRFVFLQLGAAVGGCILGFVAGFSVENIAFDEMKANDPQERFAAAIKTIPLKVALCDHRNADEAQAILANPLDAKTQKYLGYIVLNCTDSEQAKALIPQLMIQLYAQYRAGNGGYDEDKPLNYFRGEKKDDYHWLSYCAVMSRYLSSMNMARLRELQVNNLPLHCPSSNTQARLRGNDFIDSRPGEEEKAVKFIQFLHAAGVPLNTMRSATGESILDEAIDRASPAVIKALLAAGIDPGYPAGDTLQSRIYPAAVLQWVVRKHRNCEGCKGEGKSALSQAQIADVDRTMREPSAQEINRQIQLYPGRTILFKVKDFENLPDGGAAFFRYLKSRGADVGVAEVIRPEPSMEQTAEMTARLARGFLGYSNTLSPALRAELEKLTPQEIDRMAHPKVAGSDKLGQPLLVSARSWKNKVLEEFLCAHGVDGCEPVEPSEPEKRR